VKGGSNTPKNATFGYHMQKLGRDKVFFGRGSKIISSTYVHIDFGDVLDDDEFGSNVHLESSFCITLLQGACDSFNAWQWTKKIGLYGRGTYNQ